ncbi:MAG: 30S ribosome-binding factor RbfA [Tissierellales bacterium]|nr:30S ribosome-binding factor RbfA [Tissierellales bacterium]MBN2828302.1 30S ribosome-binding factor RbfA [Tissierellales bacterium]
MNTKRKARLEHDIKRYLSQIILTGVKDPRVNEHVTITEVKITEDMKYAKVYVSSLSDETNRNESIVTLNNAKGYIRKELSARLKTRFTPEIVFYLDDTIEHSIRINNLLKNISNDEKKELE